MKSTIVVVALFAGAPFMGADAAEIVVIESSAARYVAGQLLDAAAPIALAAGESVTVVTEDARMIKIEGPHNGPATGPAPDPSAVRRALAQLIVEEPPAVGGVGGVRGDEGGEQAADTRPDPWLLHAGRSGDQCVLGGENVGVWRESADEAVTAELGVLLAESSVEIRWDAGQQRAAWPAQVTLRDGAVYMLRANTQLLSVPIQLHVLAPTLAGHGLPAAAWLAAKGCTDQARLLLRASPELP